MKKDKIISILTCVLLAVGIISSVAVFGFGAGKKEPQTVTREATPQSDSVYRSCKIGEIDSAPLLYAGIENIYYTADPNGNFLFYEWDGENFSEIKSSKTTYTVKMSGQKISAEITYIKRGGKISGYGLYTSDGTDTQVHGYDYIFFRLTNNLGKLMLFASTDKNNFYSPDKIYSEAFTVSENGGDGKIYFNQRARTIGKNGASRDDYSVFTESSFKSGIFFTGRYYAIDDGKFDVMKKSSSETRIFRDAVDFYVSDSGNLKFLRQNGTSLEVIEFDGKTEKVLHNFDGELGKSLYRSGDYIIEKSGTLYNLKTDKSISFNAAKLKDGFFASVSTDGRYLVICGIPSDVENGNQRIILHDLQSGEEKVLTEPGIYKPEYPFIEWVDSSSFIANVRPIDKDGAAAVVISAEKIFVS